MPEAKYVKYDKMEMKQKQKHENKAHNPFKDLKQKEPAEKDAQSLNIIASNICGFAPAENTKTGQFVTPDKGSSFIRDKRWESVHQTSNEKD